jgi:hypothetical protein
MTYRGLANSGLRQAGIGQALVPQKGITFNSMCKCQQQQGLQQQQERQQQQRRQQQHPVVSCAAVDPAVVDFITTVKDMAALYS